MLKGKVSWFSGPKSYGFITPEVGDKDIFCHWSAIIDMEGYKSLKEGQRVEFETETGVKGLQAKNVRVVK